MIKRRVVALETEQVDKQKQYTESISAIQTEHARQMHKVVLPLSRSIYTA